MIRTEDHTLKLVFVAEENLINEKDVCYFNSQEAAENHIWKYNYLNIEATLRPFQI